MVLVHEYVRGFGAVLDDTCGGIFGDDKSKNFWDRFAKDTQASTIDFFFTIHEFVPEFQFSSLQGLLCSQNILPDLFFQDGGVLPGCFTFFRQIPHQYLPVLFHFGSN
jgi:hypothetical protein